MRQAYATGRINQVGEARAGSPGRRRTRRRAREKAGRSGRGGGERKASTGGENHGRSTTGQRQPTRTSGGRERELKRPDNPPRGVVRHPSARTSATKRAPASDRATAGAHTHALFPHAPGTQQTPTPTTTTTDTTFFSFRASPPPWHRESREGRPHRAQSRAGEIEHGGGGEREATGERSPAGNDDSPNHHHRRGRTAGTGGRGTAGAGPGRATRREPDNTRVDPPRDGHPPDKRGTPGPYSSRHGDAPAGCGGRSRTGAGAAAGPPSTRRARRNAGGYGRLPDPPGGAGRPRASGRDHTERGTAG